MVDEWCCVYVYDGLCASAIIQCGAKCGTTHRMIIAVAEKCIFSLLLRGEAPVNIDVLHSGPLYTQ